MVSHALLAPHKAITNHVHVSTLDQIRVIIIMMLNACYDDVLSSGCMQALCGVVRAEPTV